MDEEIDASFGCTREQLLRIGAPAEPDDLKTFWTALYDRALHVDPEPELTPVTGPPGVDLFEVRLTSLDGVRIGGWLSLPADGCVRRGLVVGHGYGGRDAPNLDVVPDDTAAIFPVARGLPTPSRLPGIPPTSSEHVLVGIDSVATYIHGGCAADLWCAATALHTYAPGAPLGYVGGSFGGGIGALALPWDARFSAAVLHVPSFGNHDVRLQVRCSGSGEAVREHVLRHPEAREVLRYFDAATAARRLRIRTLVAPALRDPAVPSPGQFAVYNALPGPKQLYVFSAGHMPYEDELDEYAGFVTAVRRFLSR